jgi:replicative DNA helicase
VISENHATAAWEHSVGIFSLEISKEALLRRILASQSMIDLGSILTGKMPANERENLISALDQFIGAKLHIDDTAGISLAELRSKATRLKNFPDGLDPIVVDYLQRPKIAFIALAQRTVIVSVLHMSHVVGFREDLRFAK